MYDNLCMLCTWVGVHIAVNEMCMSILDSSIVEKFNRRRICKLI
jgi:hypothetical protein